MMKRILFVLLPAAVMLVAVWTIHAQTIEVTPTTIPAGTQPTSQPTTQASSLTINLSAKPTEEEAKSIIDALAERGFGQYITGKKTLSIQEMKNPGFWIDNIKELVVTLVSFIPRLLGTSLFLFIFWLIYRGIRKMLVGSMKKQEVDSSIRDLLGGLIKWTIMGFGIVIACNQLGIPIVAMLTGVSIIGLAVGFAAQETLANFIAGIVIFLDKPFKVGDWIEVNGQQGAVKRITFRSTRFVNLDNDVVVVPNTQILANQVVNKTTNSITRVNIPIGVSYKASLDEVRAVLIATTKGDLRIEQNPEPEMAVQACAASNVDVMLHFWIKEERYQDAMKWEYLEKCKKALDAANIEIPFPHTQLILEDSPAIRRLAGKPDDS